MVAHSPGCRAQNSAHPAGGRVTSEAKTWASRSGPAMAGSTSIALAVIAAINTVVNFTLRNLVIMVATMSPPATLDIASCGPRSATLESTPGVVGWPALVYSGGTRCRQELRRETPAHFRPNLLQHCCKLVWIDTVGLHHCLDDRIGQDVLERWFVLTPIHNHSL